MIEIIAEIAQGYEGDPTLARLLARAAAGAGADAVKFQLVYADELATPGYRYYDLFKSLEMDRAAWEAVAGELGGHGPRLYFDVYGPRSLELALAVGAGGLKIHSTDFHNTALVESVLASGVPVYVSLGGISSDELAAFVERHSILGRPDVTFLVGFQAEPTPLGSTNLRRLASLKRAYPKLRLGFMDHAEAASSDADVLSLMALPYEVVCIEKHLGLDPVLELEDNVSALAPDRFADFARRVRRMAEALGSGDLELGPEEREYRRRALKVAVATRDLGNGAVIGVEDVALKRVESPAPDGLTALEQVTGRTLTRDIREHEQITSEVLS